MRDMIADLVRAMGMDMIEDEFEKVMESKY